MMRISLANNCSPSRSFRKLVLRAIEAPLTAPTRWPTSDPDTRGIEHHRHLAGLDLARIGARHRALAGLAADAFGRSEIGRMRRRGEIIVALHAGALAGDRGHRDALARAQIRAVETGRGHQHHAADPARGRRAAGLGDALDRKRRRLPPRRRGARVRPSWELCGSSRSRSGNSRASSAGSARPTYLSSGATRAIATARSASFAMPSPETSLVETTAWRCPTSTRNPTSSPSERSDSSTRPSRTSTPCDTPRTATASAASAPARLAASTSRCASVESAD